MVRHYFQFGLGLSALISKYSLYFDIGWLFEMNIISYGVLSQTQYKWWGRHSCTLLYNLINIYYFRYFFQNILISQFCSSSLDELTEDGLFVNISNILLYLIGEFLELFPMEVVAWINNTFLNNLDFFIWQRGFGCSYGLGTRLIFHIFNIHCIIPLLSNQFACTELLFAFLVLY